MNYKMIAYIVSLVMKINAYLMIIPLAVSIFSLKIESPEMETSAFLELMSFLVPIVLLLGIAHIVADEMPRKTSIFAGEGVVIVAISWIVFSVFGAIPFWLSGTLPSFIDALFESIAAFSTTGATIIEDLEILPKGLLFWRSFAQWIGGMGVLIFVMAVLPQTNSRAIHIMQAEVPGPTSNKLVSKMKDSSQLLYMIYIALTALQVISLLFAGMPFFDSITTAFATAGTGGFSIKNESIAFYDSRSIDMIIAIFMLLFGINFNIYYFMITKNIFAISHSEEMKWYLGIIAAATIVMTGNLFTVNQNLFDAFRHSFFQVTSIITTTGFFSMHFTDWPYLSQAIMMLLVIIGGSAGSTSGGIKISRIVLMVKSLSRSIKKLLHPNWVMTITMDGRHLEEDVVSGIGTYFMMFFSVFCVSLLLLVATGLDLNHAVAATIGSLNNVSAGLRISGSVETAMNLNYFAKLVLCFDMLAGRLEYFPMLALFAPSTWRK